MSHPAPARRTVRPARAAVVIAVALALPLVAACSRDTDRSSAGTDDKDRPAESSSAFPVTIEHAFGSTTIEQEPQRIVSIGFTDHDALLALGVEPVAIREWYGDHDYVWPWAEEALGDHEPELLPADDLSIEEVAALQPDLIIGQYVDLEKGEFEQLSQLADTVAQPADHPSFGAPWQLMTRNLGAAVGKAEEADALVEEVEGLFETARSEHPEFEGRGLAYAGVYGDSSASYYVETDGSTRMRVLQDLGFVVPADLAALGSDTFYHDISAENLDLLEQDVVLWEPANIDLLPEVQENRLYANLDVAQEGRDLFLTDPVVAGAMAHASVLSLPVVLEALLPELTRAVGNLDQ
ncbi:ABC transporter substrate-binding protein [Nocardioides caeni]|uniref:ABC transporter substrate-binding protein n=1 Tax=Nocardioides caeni TaxID=574700 RepID=A0A4V4HJ26_9ACTN|nr:ABC transporter substrate-binding protein [Nocardioides caeni]THV08886.1 ABC transporter substrate-binding protein [Nocardioides caeni]